MRPIATTLQLALLSLSGVIVAQAAQAAQASNVVNIYSYRQEHLISPLLDRFTQKTGIETNLITATAGLLDRIAREGRNSPADLILTTDITQLTDAKALKITQPIESRMLNRNVPETYWDPEKHWVGLTHRARFIFALKGSDAAVDIKSYNDLSNPRWRGDVCMRSGKSDYNLALISSLIAHHGEAHTKDWLLGVKQNLARKPQGNDVSQITAVSSGECTVTIGNSYYFAQMTHELAPEDQREAANKVVGVIPNQEEDGVHVNISGAALARYAPNPKEAIELLEFLASAEAQDMYAGVNMEFPVRRATRPSPRLRQLFPEFLSDTIPVARLGELRKQASQLVDQTKFDL